MAFLKSKSKTVYAPITGKIVPITEVPDPVFSENIMGEGIAIMPEEGCVVAPFDGVVVSLFPTLHAIGLRSNTGIEVLIHIGLDTVNMKGEGFVGFVSEGDKVKRGQTLITFDLQEIVKAKLDPITPVILLSSSKYATCEKTTATTVEKETDILMSIF